MPDWESLRIFGVLAKAGTFLGAARALGIEHATVARRVASLETETGLKLVDRRGRRVLLTTDGLQVAALAERMEAEAAGIDRLSAAAGQGLSGTVRLSAPPAMAAALLAAPLVALRSRHPDIHLVVAGETRYASLDRREADLAIRMTKPEKGDVVFSKIGSVRFRFWAAKAYLATVPQDRWSFIAYDDAMASAPQSLRLAQIAGSRAIGMRSSTLEFQMAAARAGGGIAMLPDFLLINNEDLAEPIVEAQPFVRDVWLVVHSDLRHVPAIRAVMDVLKETRVTL